MTIEKTDIQVPKKAENLAEQGNGNRKRKCALQDDKASNKKSCSSKHSEVCEKHGGGENTHNTVYCKRYKKDEVPKKTSKSKKGNSTYHTINTTFKMKS